MKIEELARTLAEQFGRGYFVPRDATVAVIREMLRKADLPNDDATCMRLEDMIDNIVQEAFTDWDEKQDMARSRAMLAPQEQDGNRG